MDEQQRTLQGRRTEEDRRRNGDWMGDWTTHIDDLLDHLAKGQGRLSRQMTELMVRQTAIDATSLELQRGLSEVRQSAVLVTGDEREELSELLAERIADKVVEKRREKQARMFSSRWTRFGLVGGIVIAVVTAVSSVTWTLYSLVTHVH